jgi:glycosyltransferase involved in cell wall biosynthesis
MIGKFVPMTEDFRGTFNMVTNVEKKIFPKLKNVQKYNLVLIPGSNDLELAKNYKNIIWCHVPEHGMPYEYSIFLGDSSIVKNNEAYIVQSEFHKNDLMTAYNLEEKKVFVINNAFDPIEFKEKEKENHVKFFYSGQTRRGADIVLEAFSKIKDDDISLKMHGCVCEVCYESVAPWDVDERIKILGYTSRETYLKNLTEAHIMAYPCTFQETASIAVMEALSGGLMVITSDLGALPDTSMGFAKIIKNFPHTSEQISRHRDEIVDIFVKEMKAGIHKIRKNKFDPSKQIKAINSRFTWENAEKQWLKLDNYLEKLEMI